MHAYQDAAAQQAYYCKDIYNTASLLRLPKSVHTEYDNDCRSCSCACAAHEIDQQQFNTGHWSRVNNVECLLSQQRAPD